MYFFINLERQHTNGVLNVSKDYPSTLDKPSEKEKIQFEGHFECINHEFVFEYLLKFSQWVQSLSEIKLSRFQSVSYKIVKVLRLQKDFDPVVTCCY